MSRPGCPRTLESEVELGTKGSGTQGERSKLAVRTSLSGRLGGETEGKSYASLDAHIIVLDPLLQLSRRVRTTHIEPMDHEVSRCLCLSHKVAVDPSPIRELSHGYEGRVATSAPSGTLFQPSRQRSVSQSTPAAKGSLSTSPPCWPDEGNKSVI